MTETDLPPITHELRVRCGAGEAFAIYTARIGEWWDGRYTADAQTLEGVTIEPRVGGRVYATHSDIADDEWGEVTVWEPGARIAHTFTLAQDPAHPTEVSVAFLPIATPGGCIVTHVHGGWTQANAGDRAKFGDWPVLLDRFVALADAAD